jgi:hypothetical protein
MKRAEGINRFPLFYVLLAHDKNRTQPRATPLQWGLFGVI